MRPDRTLRVLALFLPDLPLQRALRRRAGTGPLAVVEQGRVVHCTRPARAAGVCPGDSWVQARAACTALAAVPLDPAGDRAALEALAEAMLGLAPAVEVSPPHALFLDAGTGRPPAAEEELRLAACAQALARTLGWRARVAVAGGKGPSLALARHGADEVLRVAPGEEARALARLPLEALELPGAVVERLAAVGIADAGGLARLPPETLAHRFGADGATAARLARGEDPRPLVPFAPETFPEEAWDLEGTEVGVLESAEPLLFAVKRLADRVAARLAGRGLGASRLRLTLLLDPRGEERLLVPLARPGADAAAWLVPLRERIGGLRLGAPVRGLKLSVVEAAELPAEQLAVGDRPEAVRALEVVLARLAARLGEGAIFAAEPADRHRPEAAYRPAPFREEAARAAARVAVRDGARGSVREVARDAARDAERAAALAGAAPPGAPSLAGVPGDAAPLAVRPTRLVHPPRPVVAEGEGGRLTALRLDGSAHAVLALAGPERLAGEWWSDPFDRDYYRIRLQGLGDLWVYRDGRDGRLWLHGFFD
jgi:protein ImuB